jgi:phospholipid/cholesterol/gamma-HCH transport system substrate-binding protein
MEKTSHYFTVGIFVIISLLLASLFVIWLMGTHDARHYSRYTIYFYDPVSGLKNGANVQYRGVAVGNVKNIRLSPERTELIKVDIEIDENTPISQSTKASLGMTGMTGIIHIELTTQDGDIDPPVRPDNEMHPVIRGSGTQLGKLFEDVPQITKRLLELTEKVNKTFDEETVKSMQETFKNIEQMTADMNKLFGDDNMEKFNQTLTNMAAGSESIPEVAERFRKTADEVDKAVSTLNGILTDNKQDIDKFAGSGLRQITEMSRETKDMARSIRRLADRLEQDPSRLLYQPNYRGVEINQ